MYRNSTKARRNLRRGLVVTGTLAALLLPAALPAAASPLTAPGIDGYARGSSATCDHVEKPGTQALAGLLTDAFPSTRTNLDAGRKCQYDHPRGLAIDWGVSAGDERGQKFLAWLFEGNGGGQNHVRLRRLGISYIIWNGHIWTASKDSRITSSDVGDWPRYNTAACGGGDCLHVSHMHISLGDSGGAKQTSWWQPVMDGHRDSPSGSNADPTPPVSAPGMPAAVATTYVTEVYDDLLGRAPDAEGLATWVGRLTGGAQFADVANAITASDEYRSRLVDAAYHSYLDRAPDAVGARSWLDAMRAGSTVQDVQAQMLASDEFYGRAGGTSRSWVTALYSKVLGRSAGASEIDSWEGQLGLGWSRSDVALGFLTSAEHLNTVIDNHYVALLNRHADAEGMTTWVSRMQAGVREEQIIASLVSSDEYVKKPYNAYVIQVYKDLLGRSPDTTGQVFWVNELAGGRPYSSVVDGITASNEFRGALIDSAYVTYLGRHADSGGLQTWLGQMGSGRQIEDIQVQLIASDEFYGRAGGSTAGFVTLLYQTALGRGPSPDDVAFWSSRAESLGRSSVAHDVLYSAEHLGRVVDGYYVQVLHRSADAAGGSSWVGQMQAGARDEQIVAGLVTSNEYLGRL